MSSTTSTLAAPLPRWLVLLGSLVIITHLGILGISVLAERSGEWPTPFGGDFAPPPAFALAIDQVTRPSYLRPLKLTNTYHFPSNRAALPGTWLEVRLKDATGAKGPHLRLPDEGANFWVRHRQELLARHILDDRPAQPMGGEEVPAPGQEPPQVTIWGPGSGGVGLREMISAHLVRERLKQGPVFQPSEGSLLLAASYSRYLCRTHGAASAEIIRHSRMPLPPIVLQQPQVPPGATQEQVVSYGEITP